MRNLTPAELEAKYPKLRAGNYVVSSLATGRYNCMAFVRNDVRHWWQAGTNGGMFFWPEKIADTLDGWVEIFLREGFTLTDNRDVEVGVEKVAIYVDLTDMLPGHIAKSDGRCWQSKLGRLQDIEHVSLDLLEGDKHCEYGIVERVLRRPIKRTSGRRRTSRPRSVGKKAAT